MSTQKKDPREILADAIYQADEALSPPSDYQGPIGELSVWLTEDFKDELMAKFCAVLGHRPEPDQCGKPEHDYCEFCRASTPFGWKGRDPKILDTFAKGIDDPTFDPAKPYRSLEKPAE